MKGFYKKKKFNYKFHTHQKFLFLPPTSQKKKNLQKIILNYRFLPLKKKKIIDLQILVIFTFLKLNSTDVFFIRFNCIWILSWCHLVHRSLESLFNKLLTWGRTCQDCLSNFLEGSDLFSTLQPLSSKTQCHKPITTSIINVYSLVQLA